VPLDPQGFYGFPVVIEDLTSTEILRSLWAY